MEKQNWQQDQGFFHEKIPFLIWHLQHGAPGGSQSVSSKINASDQFLLMIIFKMERVLT
jgi:hypothetical protein